MDENVFLFVPNIIGYARIILAIMSCYYMPFDHVRASLYYIVSGLLDAADGYAARFLNQSSRFGAMLDQLTDRCATLCLMMVLGFFYPKWMILFQLSSALDIASHWLHMHSHDLKGSKSHKSIAATGNPILRLYYTSRPFLFFMCAGNEGFYSMLYLCYFTPGPLIPVVKIGLWKFLCVICFPVAFVKSVISFVHLVTASLSVVEVDLKDRSEQKKQ